MGSDIILAIMVVLLFTIVLSGCAMLYFLLRNARFGGAGSTVSDSDLTNQMILFQSMRETVEQQKELARQLNFSIDKKVQHVRKIIQSVADIDEHISGAEAKLDTLIKETKEELKSLNRRLGYVKDKVGLTDDEESTETTEEQPAAPREADSEESIPVASIKDANGNDVPYNGSEKLPPLHAIAGNFKETRDLVDTWTGVDFGVQQIEDPVIIDEPHEPEEAEASRDAFRTLLNMKSGQAGEDFIEESLATVERDEELTPVQRRIYEFSDAGMRVPDIAKELGVGKGEVKLILSMRGSQT